MMSFIICLHLMKKFQFLHYETTKWEGPQKMMSKFREETGATFSQ